MLRVALVLALLTTHAGAERRKKSLPGDVATRSPYRRLTWRTWNSAAAPHFVRLRDDLLVGVAASAGKSTGIDQQVRYFVFDELSVGGRIRVSSLRTVYEAELGFAVTSRTVRVAGQRARLDTLVLGGLGAQLEGQWLPFAGTAIRVHPLTTSGVINMLAFELAARATGEPGWQFTPEATLGVSVLVPMRY